VPPELGIQPARQIDLKLPPTTRWRPLNSDLRQRILPRQGIRKVVLLDGRDPGVGDLQRYRLRGAFCHRNERAGRRSLIPKMLIEIAPDALR
jgi:hypothetical protein